MPKVLTGATVSLLECLGIPRDSQKGNDRDPYFLSFFLDCLGIPRVPIIPFLESPRDPYIVPFGESLGIPRVPIVPFLESLGSLLVPIPSGP